MDQELKYLDLIGCIEKVLLHGDIQTPDEGSQIDDSWDVETLLSVSETVIGLRQKLFVHRIRRA